MAQKDKVQRTLESYNDVFADIVNVLLFEGQEVVKEDELTDAQPFSYYKMDGKKVRSQERDVSKYWNNGIIRLSFIGLENQMKVDKFMPLRVMGYDGASYRSQLLEKPKKACYPTITLVLYFGTKRRWKRYRTLKESILIPSRLEAFVSDYKINVFELAWLTDEKIQCFKSDFRDVALFLRSKRTGNLLKVSERRFKHVMEIMDLFRVMADNDKNLLDALSALSENPGVEKGGISMGTCTVVQQWVDIGSERRAKEDARSFYSNGASIELIAKSLKMTIEQVKEIVKDVTVTA